MKVKTKLMGYDAYLKRMEQIGDTKLHSITVDAERYAEYVRRMELNQILLEDIQKQHMRTVALRKRIVGQGKKDNTKWMRIMMVEDD